MSKLFLDDLRPTPPGWIRAYTADETIALLVAGQVEELSLDYDLEEAHYGRDYSVGKTGGHVVSWLLSKVQNDPGFQMPRVQLHTRNVEGREEMQKGLDAIGKLLQDRRLAALAGVSLEDE